VRAGGGPRGMTLAHAPRRPLAWTMPNGASPSPRTETLLSTQTRPANFLAARGTGGSDNPDLSCVPNYRGRADSRGRADGHPRVPPGIQKRFRARKRPTGWGVARDDRGGPGTWADSRPLPICGDNRSWSVEVRGNTGVADLRRATGFTEIARGGCSWRERRRQGTVFEKAASIPERAIPRPFSDDHQHHVVDGLKDGPPASGGGGGGRGSATQTSSGAIRGACVRGATTSASIAFHLGWRSKRGDRGRKARGIAALHQLRMGAPVSWPQLRRRNLDLVWRGAHYGVENTARHRGGRRRLGATAEIFLRLVSAASDRDCETRDGHRPLRVRGTGRAKRSRRPPGVPHLRHRTTAA